MRCKRVVLLLVLSVTSAACASHTSRRPPVGVGFDREAETKAVYSAVLNGLYARDWLNREVKQWVIDPEIHAVIGGRDDLIRNRIEDARADALADFERPRPAGRVPPDLAPGLPVRWFTDVDFAALPKAGDGAGYGWAAFHQKFPGSPGHVTLSRIGFSVDGTEAIVEPGCWFDSLGGARTIVRLRKVHGNWQVKQRSQTAVS